MALSAELGGGPRCFYSWRSAALLDVESVFGRGWSAAKNAPPPTRWASFEIFGWRPALTLSSQQLWLASARTQPGAIGGHASCGVTESQKEEVGAPCSFPPLLVRIFPLLLLIVYTKLTGIWKREGCGWEGGRAPFPVPWPDGRAPFPVPLKALQRQQLRMWGGQMEGLHQAEEMEPFPLMPLSLPLPPPHPSLHQRASSLLRLCFIHLFPLSVVVFYLNVFCFHVIFCWVQKY